MERPKILTPEEETALENRRRSADCSPAQCSASAWTVHWTSDDGMKSYHQDFKEAHKVGNWVRMLLEKGKTAVSVMVKE